MGPEKHPLGCGPGQQTPTVLEEWRKIPAGTSPGAAQQRPHEPTVAGGNWVSQEESGISDPQKSLQQDG